MAGWAHRCGHPVAFMAIESCMRTFVEKHKKSVPNYCRAHSDDN